MQQNLFGKSETEEEIEFKNVPNKEEDEVDFEDKSDSCWTDFNHQEAVNDKEHGFSYLSLSLHSTSNLEGIKHQVLESSTCEPPSKFMGGYWRSGGDDSECLISGDKLKIEEYFEEVKQQKLENRETPYKELKEELWELESHEGSEWYRLIPMKNFVIIIDKKLQGMIKATGFDFDRWYEEYRNIPENNSIPEYDAKVEKAKEILLAAGSGISKVDYFKKSIKFKLGQTEHYGEKMKDYFPEKGVDELLKELKQIKLETANFNTELLELGYKDLYYPGYDSVLSYKDIDKVVMW